MSIDVNPELEQDVSQLWSLLFTIVLDGEKRMAAYMGAHQLTPPQFYVLKTLMERGGRCPIGEIARQHHLTNATMTGLVKRLEALGLVMREQSATDRRSVEVSLTASGEARFLAVQIDLMEQVRMIFSLVSASERQDLIRYLARYVEMIGAQFPLTNVQS
ncbi:MAG: MarR family transcriptional regulator [Anaerolineae bacterium]|nr:MarR family transcriptional regulator [Anaerolineae bacterium]